MVGIGHPPFQIYISQNFLQTITYYKQNTYNITIKHYEKEKILKNIYKNLTNNNLVSYLNAMQIDYTLIYNLIYNSRSRWYHWHKHIYNIYNRIIIILCNINE